MNRRSLLHYLTNLGGLMVTAVVGVPSLIAALSPALRRGGGERWQFPLEQMTEGIVEVPRDDSDRSLRRKLVYVYRAAEETIVYSRNCTDLSCPVVWDGGSQCFFCPCHGGIFSKQGAPMAGPPPEPLFRYANRVRGGELEIDLNSVPPMA
jgi:menaquinol-cytochrome c reductase iron-sulfur subunit